MYTPKQYVEHDDGMIQKLVREHAFGMLIVPRADGQIEIAHVPFFLDVGGSLLRVHVARANPIWRDVMSEDRRGDVVVVFNGPHGYVSPRWYEKPTEHVPTWNYVVVHAHVRKPMLLSKDELLQQLDELAKEYEHGPEGWRLDVLATEFRDQLLKAIVGLSLPVVRWEAKSKLSQNRSVTDHARVLAAFEKRGTPDDLEMASRMGG